MMRSLLKLSLAVAAVCSLLTAAAHNIDNRLYEDGRPVLIPEPKRYEAEKGVLALPAEITVSAPECAAGEVETLKRLVKEYFPDRAVRQVKKEAFCRLELVKEGVPESPEGYTLAVGGEGIVIRSRDVRGLFYGVQTVGNLLRNAEKPELPCCRVTDWPDFARRGIYYEWRCTRNSRQLARCFRCTTVHVIPSGD